PSGEEEKKDAKDPGNKDSEDNAVDENIVYGCADDPNMLVSHVPTTRIHKDHPLNQVIRDLNKKDERGIVIKNKARLVAQGYTQEKRIDYNEVFAPVARIEAIRLFLAYALFKDFVVYQMDVKSIFFSDKIEEEVYVCQPLGFEDPDFPNRVYKVEKALYGLHQVPRAWYETLSTYLLDNGFQRGKIDKTLFIQRDKSNILLVRKEDGIFISQDKYVNKILNKLGFSDMKTTSTPMETHKHLLKDEDGIEVDINTHIDNESTICIVKNPVFHSKTKHIEIRHHFIRDSNKKKLIQMIKIHTDQNVVDFLIKAFDVSRFQYMIVIIGMLTSKVLIERKFMDDPKTFDEATKSQDVAFWKEAINDEMDFIMGNNTWVLADLPLGCKPIDCK
nr:putative ribonuclease H-like domain-containing protein [Tanacetum cinerariifolium]